MNKAILSTDIQDFISENLNTDISRISLGKSPFPAVSSKEIAEQVDSKKRSESKLPLWFKTAGIYYPTKLAIEQASSEAAARYKSNLIRGDKIIDLTGGFGVDTYFFSKIAANVTHCEINQYLSEISRHNSIVLGTTIHYVNADGLEYLNTSRDTFDTIYIDPSRRINTRKVFMLKDCEPDVVKNMDLLFKKASRIIIKTAPLLDIQSTLKELRHVNQVHVISLKNDCKELLWLIDKEKPETDPQIICAALRDDQVESYTFKMSDERAFPMNEYSEPLAFIYEPDVALLKAGCFKLITRDFAVKKIHQHTHLYTSTELNTAFIGRRFKTRKVWNYRTFINEQAFRKANIICRNFPLSPDILKNKHKISDGGQDYLLFCTGSKNELLVLNCERV